LGNVGKLLPQHPEVDSTLEEIGLVLNPLPQRNKDRLDQLQKELLRQRQLENQRLKYFEDMRELDECLFAAEEYINNPVETDTEQSLIALVDPLKRISSSVKLPDNASPDEEAELNEVKSFFFFLFFLFLFFLCWFDINK